MKALNKLIMILSVVGLLTWAGCKEEPPCNDPTNPDCANYDPCYGEKPVTADFEIGYILRVTPPFDEYVEEFQPDYAFERVMIGFRVKNYNPKDSVKYTWLLGAEVIHEPQFERNFSRTTEKRDTRNFNRRRQAKP